VSSLNNQKSGSLPEAEEEAEEAADFEQRQQQTKREMGDRPHLQLLQ
jgi:hypothetical protein